MMEYTHLTFEELCGILEQPADTLILMHRVPDADAIGSAFALRQMLEDLGSAAWCISCDELPQRLRFLTAGLQESILPESIPAEFAPTRVISVDVPSPEQLGSLAGLYADAVDVMIDHHAVGTRFANSYISAEAAATGEIIFDLVKLFAQRGQVEITEQLCTDLYAAISGDTGGFRHDNVTPETHARASELVASGINCAEINRCLFETRSLEQLRAVGAGISNLQLREDGRIAVILFPYALKAALGLQEEHLATLVDIIRPISGVEVAVAIRQPTTEGLFQASLRSNGEYDVAELCELFGGGGHKRAAGCTLLAENIEDAMEKLLSQINFSELN